MGEVSLTIQTKTNLYVPVVLDGITLDMERSGSPSKLSFTIIKDYNISFGEGDLVKLSYNGTPMFVGYVFTKKRDKEQHITVTAYDQMRYMKNKFTYVFTNKTATQILQAVCADFGIKTGSLENTGYVIPSLIEENKSLFDIVLDALDETLTNTGQLYILYDNAGKLELKNMANMKTGLLIDHETAQNFSYESSIDEETYNKVVLYYIDKNTNDRVIFSASDPKHIGDWGLLQYFEEVKTPSIGQSKANSLLKLYDKKTRKLTINDAFGSPTVRAGSLIPVQLNVGDTIISNLMLVDKIKHKFSTDNYTMDITLNGNWRDNDQGVTVSKTYGAASNTSNSSNSSSGSSNSSGSNSSSGSKDSYVLTVNIKNTYVTDGKASKKINVAYTNALGEFRTLRGQTETFSVLCKKGTDASVSSDGGASHTVVSKSGQWVADTKTMHTCVMTQDSSITIRWV